MPALFRVANTFEVTGVGPYIYGDILDGTIKIGMHVALPRRLKKHVRFLTIDGIEFLDRISTKDFWIGLHFKEKLTLEQIQALFEPEMVLAIQEVSPHSSQHSKGPADA
ncbi:MAG: hypothetical protein KY468_00995 [Armatimonadetes bacterium]|nr:hypothetical protein [Armatimonadota bacterium]